MSPEELEKARCLMESHEAIKKQTGRALLAHIDEQAKQIDVFQEHENQTHEIMGRILGKDDSLEQNATRAIQRIETLKAACHAYLQKSIHLDHPDRSLESANVAAKKQLARELPDIFGEDEI